MIDLIAPHGGLLKERLLPEDKACKARLACRDLPSWDLTPRQLCDLELIMNGGFSPLEGFMGQADYETVLDRMRLADGTLWPIPVTLDVAEESAKNLNVGVDLALRDPEGVLLGVLHILDIWKPDKQEEAQQVYGTTDPVHPGVDYLINHTHPIYIGGKVSGISMPVHYDFKELRHTPHELRDYFRKMGWQKVIAFQTRNPMHRVHYELTLRAAETTRANLLIHPVVGMTKPGDIDYYTRVHCYMHVAKKYPKEKVFLSLLPLAMRMAGPREALWHALIRKNYGCTHFIIGRDHAGPGKDLNGNGFYGPYDAHELLRDYKNELGIEIVPANEVVYVENSGKYIPEDKVTRGQSVKSISATEIRERLEKDIEIPEWLSFPEVVEELKKNRPPRHKRGFTVFFTGLSGAGKSTIANALRIKLMQLSGRGVTFLDGDVVRKHLSSELGFSREHRDLNILRIGFVASEVVKHGGIAICAPIAPYAQIRKKVREMVMEYGGFIEVYVATPLDVCEDRDRKGLYAKARAGIIKQFTGVSDPYEPPEKPELTINTTEISPDDASEQIIAYLKNEGYLKDQ